MLSVLSVAEGDDSHDSSIGDNMQAKALLVDNDPMSSGEDQNNGEKSELAGCYGETFTF